MALVWHTNDAMQPPSPSFSNPDMILPYQPTSSERPASQDHFGKDAASFDARAALSSRGSQSTTGSKWGHTSSLSRPSMPGEWQTESDLQNVEGAQAEPSRDLLGDQRDVLNSRNSFNFEDTATETRRIDSVGKKAEIESPMADVNRKGNPVPLKVVGKTGQNSTSDEDGDSVSQIAFERAEQILANAKKRLTTMESNLTRARSLSISRSTSVASNFTDERSPASARFSVDFSRSNGWAISAAKLRNSSFNNAAQNGGHSRVFSETAVPDSRLNHATKPYDGNRVRATSAMGPGFSGQSDMSQEEWAAGTRRLRQLDPLHEDEHTTSPSNESSRRGTPTFSSSALGRLQHPTNQITKARSSIQLRDLREQMQDLRGKVQSLKQRTREESLQRRSIQMLKSPSPFTDAEAWSSPASSIIASAKHSREHSVDPNHNRVQQTLSPEAQATTSPSPSRDMGGEAVEPAQNDMSDGGRNFETRQVVHSSPREVPLPLSSPHSERAELVDIEEDDDDDYGDDERREEATRAVARNIEDGDEAARAEEEEGEEGEEETSPFDDTAPFEEEEAQTAQLSHEDRPDAFDYENFVINSAMGSFSRQGKRSSTLSSSSASTSTIGPVNGDDERYSDPSPETPNSDEYQTSFQLPPSTSTSPPHGPFHHSRQGSTDSASSGGTFATAVSGTPGSRSTSRLHSRNAQYQPSNLSNSMLATPGNASSTSLTNSQTNNLNLRPSSILSFSRPRPPSTVYENVDILQDANLSTTSFSSFSNQFQQKPQSQSRSQEPTNIRARSQILSAMLSDHASPTNPAATSESMGRVVPEDEALLRAVIDGMQRCCGRLVRGEGLGDVRERLELARKALEGEGAGRLT